MDFFYTVFPLFFGPMCNERMDDELGQIWHQVSIATNWGTLYSKYSPYVSCDIDIS